MGIKILAMRHRFAPEVNGCRWCGASQQEHANRWIRSRGWHTHVEPTDAQRKARLKAHIEARHKPRIFVPPLMAQWGRTANDARTRL